MIGMAIQNKVDSKKAIEEWRNRQHGIGKAKKVLTKSSSKEKTADKKLSPQPTVIEKPTEDAEKKPRVDSGIVEDGNPPPDELIPVKAELEDIPNEIPIQSNTAPVLEPPTEDVPPLQLNQNGSDAIETNAVVQSQNTPPTSMPAPPAPIDEKQDLINIIDEEANRRKKKPSAISRRPSKENVQKTDTPGTQQTQPPTTTQLVNGIGSATTKNPLKKTASVDTKLETEEKPKPSLVRPRTSLRPPSVRPASARPGAPRKRDRHVEVVVHPNENVQLGDINVKVEQFKPPPDAANNLKANEDADDDDHNLIIIEDMGIQETLLKHAELEHQDSAAQLNDDANHGQLVKQILDSQKEFEATTTGSAEKTLDRGGHGVLQDLRDQMQKLTKSIQPLGKFMDFLLEDIDSMQREYELWTDRGREVAVKLAREKNAQEGTVVSLRHQLEELESELQEKDALLFTVRANLLQNEEKIVKLFKNL